MKNFESQQPDSEEVKRKKSSFPESGTQIEIELSPEVIEKIMEKVQDINEAETGLHSISQHSTHESREVLSRLDFFEREMKDGILGQNDPYSVKQPTENKEEWLNKVKERKGMFLYFNIIGREIDKVEDSFWFDERIRENPVAILFDINSFREVDVKDFTHKYDVTGNIRMPALDSYPTKTFGRHGTNSRDVKIETPPKSGNYVVRDLPGYDMGYALNFRVSPRFFRGVVFRVDREVTDDDRKPKIEEVEKRREEHRKEFGYDRVWQNGFNEDFNNIHRWKLIEDSNETNTQKRVDEIVGRMKKAVESKEDRLVPIYDVHGNLWWPKKMSYEEIKSLVSKTKIEPSEE